MKLIFLFISVTYFTPLVLANDFMVDSRVAQPRSVYATENNSSSETGVSGANQNEIPEGDSSLGQKIENSGGFTETKQGGLEGANNLSNEGSGVQLMGLAMAASFAPQCGPHNPFACVAVGLSIADSIAGGGAKSAGFQQGSYLDNGRGVGATGTNPAVEQQIEDLKAELEGQGYSVNGDGSVTSPAGDIFTAEDMANEEAIQSAFGMSAGGAKSAMGQLASVQLAAANKAGINLPERNPASEQGEAAGGGAEGAKASSDSGGKGSAIGGVTETDQLIEEVEFRKKKKKKNGLSAKSAALLSKNFNGDPIGIGMADLFLIVHQKYREKKSKKNEFINKEY